jgi:hypothetical protein
MSKKSKTAPQKVIKQSARGTLHSEKGTFVKGNVRPPNTGRARGTRNRTTTLLKDAILTAATLVGKDGKGKDGLVGFLMSLTKEKAVYARLLEKVLPMQVSVEDKTKYTPAEALQRLRERGLPLPPSLLSLASSTEKALMVASALNDQHGDVVTDHLDNRNADAWQEEYRDELNGEDNT